MGLLDELRDAVIPRTEKGVHYRCTTCDTRLEESYAECPECGATDIKEEEGFELRPRR